MEKIKCEKIFLEKIQCQICNSIIAKKSLYKHMKSKKCMNSKKNIIITCFDNDEYDIGKQENSTISDSEEEEIIEPVNKSNVIVLDLLEKKKIQKEKIEDLVKRIWKEEEEKKKV